MIDCVAGACRFSVWKVALLAGIVWMAADLVGQATEEPAAGTDATAKPAAVSYFRDVRPIFQANCQGCHQPAKAGGSLDMTAFKTLLTGGESEYTGHRARQARRELSDRANHADRRRSGDAARQEAAERCRNRAHQAVDRRRRRRRHAGGYVAAHRRRTSARLQRSARNHVARLVAGWHAAGRGRVPRSAAPQGRRQRARRAAGRHVRADRIGALLAGRHEAGRHGRPARLRWAKCKFGMSRSHELLLSVPVTYDTLYRRILVARRQARRLWRDRYSRCALIDAETGEQVLFQSAHDDWVLGTVFSVDGSHLVSVGRDMTAKLIEVPTQRFVDNITSITPGALKGGIQSVERHPLRDEILFGGADGTPRIYRMHRVTARVDWRRCEFVVGTAAVAGTRVQRRYHGRRPHDRRRQQPRRPRACHTSITWSRRRRFPDRSKRFSTSRCSQPQRATKRRSCRSILKRACKTLAKVEVAEGGVYAVALSPSGDRVAAAGGDGTVRLIQHAERQPRWRRFGRWKSRAAEEETRRDVKRGSTESRLPLTHRRLSEPPLPARRRGRRAARSSRRPISLDGPARYAQIVVTAELASGARVDVTRQAKLRVRSAGGKINTAGVVTPSSKRSGPADRSRWATSRPTSTCKWRISTRRSIRDFVRDIAPILARAGCNQGTCHGAQAGKNGFKLSLRGYDPVFDLRALTDDLASRRVNVASPAQSLMLLKPTAAVPHHRRPGDQAGQPYYETIAELDCRRCTSQPHVAARDRHSNHAVQPDRGIDRRAAANPRGGHVCGRHAARRHPRSIRGKRQHRRRENRARAARLARITAPRRSGRCSCATKATTRRRRSP